MTGKLADQGALITGAPLPPAELTKAAYAAFALLGSAATLKFAQKSNRSN